MFNQTPGPFKMDMMLCDVVYNELKVFNQPVVPAEDAFELLGRISQIDDLKFDKLGGTELYRALTDKYILSASALDVSDKDRLHWKLYPNLLYNPSDVLFNIGRYQMDDYTDLDFLRVVGAENHIDELLELFNIKRVSGHIPREGTNISIHKMSRFIRGIRSDRLYSYEYKMMEWIYQYIPEEYRIDPEANKGDIKDE